MNDSTNPFGEPSANSRQRADQPIARSVDEPWMSLREWQNRHRRGLQASHRNSAQLAFVGDSITEAWCESAAFLRHFAEYRPLNLGVAGDQTQHLLWRIENGALDDLSPSAVISMIGVNNLGNGHAPEQTALGVAATAVTIRTKLPKAPLLLIAILPAARLATDALRRNIDRTNALIASAPLPSRTSLVQIGAALLDPDASIAPSTMEDFLHPTALGYEKLTTAIVPHLRRILRH